MITVQKLSYRAGATCLLDGISHTFAAQRITVILGPNGAGKSTFIRLLAGLLKPSEGTISLEKRSLQNFSGTELAGLRAYLPQNHALTFPITVGEVLQLAQVSQRGISTKHPDQIRALTEVLQAFQLTALRERSYTTLSGGEQQRVQIARVMLQLWSHPATRPALYLLDEPLNGLDLRHQQSVLRLIRSATRTGRTSVLALHDINAAAQLADDLIFLKGGKVFAAGPVERVFTESVLKAVFDVDIRLLRGGPNERQIAVLPFT